MKPQTRRPTNPMLGLNRSGLDAYFHFQVNAMALITKSHLPRRSIPRRKISGSSAADLYGGD